jgi:hypothetical protein
MQMRVPGEPDVQAAAAAAAAARTAQRRRLQATVKKAACEQHPAASFNHQDVRELVRGIPMLNDHCTIIEEDGIDPQTVRALLKGVPSESTCVSLLFLVSAPPSDPASPLLGLGASV